MRFPTLTQWLDWQETLHPTAIDLGLERIRPVADTLGLLAPHIPTITVAGTNGKGSCVAYAEAILLAAGYRTGAYTSPHLLRYNERIRICGRDVDDDALLRAFAAVDLARNGVTLSYFEFGTLAALWLFRDAGVDVRVLEVGLGGRLDAVNLVDADAALITSIGIDHVEWLGPDVESIGREKAGVFRPGRPAVFAAGALPESVVVAARDLGTPLCVGGRDYHWQVAGDGRWDWQQGAQRFRNLPAPAMAGQVQYANAGSVLAVLTALQSRLPVSEQAVHQGLAKALVAGRMQRVTGAVEWFLDVAHNAASAQVLAQALAAEPVRGRRLAVVAMLRRKDMQAVLTPLSGLMDGWYLLALPDSDEAWPPEAVRAALGDETVLGQGDIASLMPRINGEAQPGDQVVVFGSFRTVEAVMRYGSG